MSADRDFEELAANWLSDGPGAMPERALDAALADVHRTRQVRVGKLRRATPFDFRLVQLAAAVAIAIAVIGVVSVVLSGSLWNDHPAQLPPIEPGPLTPSPATSQVPTQVPTSPLPLGYLGGGTITFTRFDQSLAGDAIWLINPDGSAETKLIEPTSDPGFGTVPGTGCCGVFSPDGTQIAIGYDVVNPRWSDAGSTPGTWLLSSVINLDGTFASGLPVFCGGCGSVANRNALPRAWSPDGSLVAIEVWNDPISGLRSTTPQVDGINLAPTCTSDCQNVSAGCGRDFCDWQTQVTGIRNRDVPVAFSPDGGRLLFVRLSSDDMGALMMLTLGTGAVDQVTPDGWLVYADDYFGPAASWSADGKQIAFAATDDSGSPSSMSAYVAWPDGTSRVAIAGPTPYLTGARWSPDGSWIAYDEGSPYHDLHVVRPDGTHDTNLTATFVPGICCARWSPDSQALLGAATIGSNDNSDLYIVPIDGGQVYRVTTTPALYTSFSWGPATR